MDFLKKPNNLPWICGGLGLLGMAARFWLLQTGFDEKGLLITGHLGSWVCLLLSALAVAAVAVALWGKGDSRRSRGMFPASPLAALGAAVGCVGLALAAWADFKLAQSTLDKLTYWMGFAAAAALGYLAWCRLKGLRSLFLVRVVVNVYLMLHLIHHYQQWFSEPQLAIYLPRLLAQVLVLLACYHRTALETGWGSRRPYIVTGQLAGFFCLLGIPGTDDSFFYLAMAAWMLLDTGRLQLPAKHAQQQPMVLPEYVARCARQLEQAGYQWFAVGGCVRDHLLGLTPHDYDLCTDASPEQLKQVFAEDPLVLSGEKHGTVSVVTENGLVEITTFRTEGGYQDSRHPEWVKFVATIEEDLSRRDFTVNAMAWNESRGFVDPYGGKEDLQNRILRAVGDPATRFREDALRILRGVRFAVRFRLTPEKNTLEAMEELSPLLDNLAVERIFEELCKLLPLVTAEDLLRYKHILARAIPELAPTLDFQQHTPWHAYDVFTHTAHVVEAVPPVLHLRWAALLHDIGKPATFHRDENGRGHFTAHAKVGSQIANETLLRLKAPTALREKAVRLIEQHMTKLEPDKKLLRRRLAQFGPEGVQELYALQHADFCSKGVARREDEEASFRQIAQLLEELRQEDACLHIRDLAVNGSDLMELGFAPGPGIGHALNTLLEQVIDQELPNEKNALLARAKELLSETK